MKRILFLILVICTSVVLTASASVTGYRYHPAAHYSYRSNNHYIRHSRAKKSRPVVLRSSVYQPPRNKVRNMSAAVLNQRLNGLIRDSGVTADISVHVKSMQSNETLYAYYVNRSMTPASVLKILTAESALLFLGPNYRFQTKVLSNSNRVRYGELQGDLYIELSGDPTLTYDDLVGLLDEVKNKNINSIRGNVYIDSTAYDKQVYGPGWGDDDKQYCYAAPISASIINHNCLQFKVTPANTVGHKATVTKAANSFYPQIDNQVVTKYRTSSNRCSLQVSKDNGHITLDGCMERGRYASGVSYVIDDIPEYNRKLVQNLLSQRRITYKGTVLIGKREQHLKMISSHASDPLNVMIRRMLKKSDNVFAGAIFKKIGQQYSGRQGSWENGSMAVAKILSSQAGVETQGLRILDGSGLSQDNLVKASQLMQLLQFAYHHNPTSHDFISALPISGVDGTLKHRMQNITRRVRAKTGTISGVASLAGYIRTRGNQNLAFVIMINGSKAYGWKYKALEDKIVNELANYG